MLYFYFTIYPFFTCFMPKTIDYPRTSYLGAWEVAEVVDDTGGKCAIETAARKLSRKVSGSFKAIIGSAVKFGLLTSKRELLTTTNLFRRIKNAYDKQEELIYHREAFLHPPLFTQICRKFRNRELPVHMFDVMLVREFNVEEINAQSVSKAFVEGARMAGILDEQNIIADIDQLAAQQQPRRELSGTDMPLGRFQQSSSSKPDQPLASGSTSTAATPATPTNTTGTADASRVVVPTGRPSDAVASLFGLDTDDLEDADDLSGESFTQPAAIRTSMSGAERTFVPPPFVSQTEADEANTPAAPRASTRPVAAAATTEAGPSARALPPTAMYPPNPTDTFTIRLYGPGLDTTLSLEHIDDLELVQALLNKIRRQLPR